MRSDCIKLVNTNNTKCLKISEIMCNYKVTNHCEPKFKPNENYLIKPN